MPETTEKLTKEQKDAAAEEEFRKLTQRTTQSLPEFAYTEPGEEVSSFLSHRQNQFKIVEMVLTVHTTRHVIDLTLMLPLLTA